MSAIAPVLNPAPKHADIDAQLEREFACNCAETAIRKRTCSNGTEQFVRQCLSCGARSSWLPRSSVGPREQMEAGPIDDRIGEARAAARWARRAELLEPVRDAERRERLEELAAYYETPEWKEKRRRCLERDGHGCQARLPHCQGRATQAHHLTYEHLFSEPLFDLTSVCERCHHRITEMDRERRG